MSPFKTHGIEHVSASQLTTFASDPSRWFAQKILGYRAPSGASMERGKAVEVGLVHWFQNRDHVAAIEAAEASYDKACRFNVLGDIDGERGNIAPMVTNAIGATVEFGAPEWPAEGAQHKVEIPIRFGPDPDDVIPIIGYLDFVFADRVIDLKSTTRIPSDMSFAHRIQAAVYARTTNKPVQFLYVSAKKTALLDPGDHAQAQAAARAIVQRMAAFLALSPNPEILQAAVPVISDSWSWKGEEDVRRHLFGL